MPAAKPTTATFRTRLLAAQSVALDTLLHLAQDLTNPTQARLASTALLRTRLPDAEESDAELDPDAPIASDSSSASPSAAPPSTPPCGHARPERRQPHAGPDATTSRSLSALAAALERITRAPSGVAATLLASGAPIGQSSTSLLLTG
jgi:hypothetical protein